MEPQFKQCSKENAWKTLKPFICKLFWDVVVVQYVSSNCTGYRHTFTPYVYSHYWTEKWFMHGFKGTALNLHGTDQLVWCN